MDAAKIVNSVGLLFDIAGAILLFLYGLPKWIPKDGEELILNGGDLSEPQDGPVDTYTWRSRLGLGLLIVGFVLQLLSNCIPASR